MKGERTVGFWILIIPGILILGMLLVGQVMALIDYEFTVSMGLQESVDVVGKLGVALNKGFAVGDTLIYLPLLFAGIMGLYLRKEWGIITMAGALGITAYWPVVCIFYLLFAIGTPVFSFKNFILYTLVLTPFALYGIWGLFYLYRERNLLTG